MRLVQPWSSTCRWLCPGSRNLVSVSRNPLKIYHPFVISAFVSGFRAAQRCDFDASLIPDEVARKSPEERGTVCLVRSISSDWSCSSAIGSEGGKVTAKGVAMAPGAPSTVAVDGIVSNSSGETRRTFEIVVAATRKLGIGRDGKLPWKLPIDMKFFKSVTSSTSSPSRKNAVIMGRHTWESIPEQFRPLPDRLNVVLTRSGVKSVAGVNGDVVPSDSLDSALALLAAPPFDSLVESVFVIGGGQVFQEAMTSPQCHVIHLTEIETDVNCDTYMPAVDDRIFRIWSASFPVVENGIRFSFLTYVKSPSEASLSQGGLAVLAGISHPLSRSEDTSADVVAELRKSVLEAHEEYQYLKLIQDIISTGTLKGDRTGTGTISKFGCQMRFNLRKSFPLLTTKRVFWRGVVEELLWFISGSTNSKVLQEKGVHIWNGNGTRKYLDGVGLKEREEGDLGPVYGFQWRHFGAKYTDMHADYSGQGYDQLADVIKKIRCTPDDRRILLSAWNPADLKLMALPPCHMFAQFYVANGELSCQMYQRSCDMGLGVPFNIASYALLTCILAHVCDLVPGDFVHVLGDAHVYKNHVEPLQEQLQNVPKPFPLLRIKTANRDIDSFSATDFELVGYESSKKIAMKMAI